MARVVGIDFDERRVLVADGDPITYDYLILAAGRSEQRLRRPGCREHALPLKSLEDAIDVRTTVLRQFEAADRDHALDRAGRAPHRGRRRRTDRRGAQRRARRAVHEGARQGLRHARRQVCRGHAHRGHRRAPRRLLRAVAGRSGTRARGPRRGDPAQHRHRVGRRRRRRTGRRDAHREPGGDLVRGGEGQPARRPARAPADGPRRGRGERRSQRRHSSRGVRDRGPGRGHDRPDGRPYPQLAPVAMQQARHVARSIVRRRRGKKTRRFRYVEQGDDGDDRAPFRRGRASVRDPARRNAGMVELARRCTSCSSSGSATVSWCSSTGCGTTSPGTAGTGSSSRPIDAP